MPMDMSSIRPAALSRGATATRGLQPSDQCCSRDAMANRDEIPGTHRPARIRRSPVIRELCCWLERNEIGNGPQRDQVEKLGNTGRACRSGV